jgi:uncharacterized protein YyaL (SSP411 family)
MGRLHRDLLGVVAVAVLVSFVRGSCTLPPPQQAEQDQQPEGRNRLAQEVSPYLRLHADDPVHWFPWGEEAFRKAQAEGKPIFLSIGYTACHWCHVMERESFEDAEVARILNKHFVAIKVDREERPDVDEVYLTAVVLLTGQAGWPLSVFLTPEGKPFFGGTYFPREDRDGREGFKTILKRVVDAWQNRREEVTSFADRVARSLRLQLGPQLRLSAGGADRTLIETGAAELKRHFDATHGGFVWSPDEPEGPKFPKVPQLELLAYLTSAAGSQEAKAMLRTTLNRMREGGLFDHLGGGFHRYATDRRWEIPHFEKMLYDNALLLGMYARAFELFQEPDDAQVVRRTAEFLFRELRSPEGGFYSSLGADVEGVEGRYYGWTREEVRQLLTEEEYRLVERVFGLGQPPNFDEHYVLYVAEPLSLAASRLRLAPERASRLLESARQKLWTARQKRPRPMLDDKVVTAWNGLAVAAFARAAVALKEPAYLEAADQTARWLCKTLWPDSQQLWRIYCRGQVQVPGLLDDYASLAWAFLELHQASLHPQWLSLAQQLAHHMIARFWSEEAGTLRLVSSEAERHLPVLPHLVTDAPTPAGWALAIRVLVRIATQTGDLGAARVAGTALFRASPVVSSAPSNYPTVLLALGEYLDAGLPREYLQGRKGAEDRGVTYRTRVRPEKVRPGDSLELEIKLEIPPGWHLMAHTPGYAGGVPLRLEIQSVPPLEELRVVYPPGQAGKIPGFAEEVRVLQGQVELRVTAKVPRQASSKIVLQVQLRYQPCNDTMCLAPRYEAWSVEVPVEESSQEDPSL